MAFKTYAEAAAALPAEAKWTASFGYPGEGGYTEYHRTPEGKRFKISNGSWAEAPPFIWTMEAA